MRRAVFFGFLCTAVIALGAPPQNVAGMTFFHSIPGLDFFAGTTDQLLLNPDGTYTGLISRIFRQGTSLGGAGGSVLVSELAGISIPPNGTWAYRVIDQTTAEFILDGLPLQLHFDEDKTSGIVGAPKTLTSPNPVNERFSFDTYNASARIVNSSTRCYLAPGRSVSLGFVVAEGTRRVLVRAIGPGLRVFGVSQPLDNPTLNVSEARFAPFPVDFALPAISRATLDTAALRAGTFPLPSANDRGNFLTLQPGAYIADVTAADNQSSGEVLVEVYQLP